MDLERTDSLRHVDVVVLGAGMAGMCAAAATAAAGAITLVVESATTIGGSAALSHGTVWTVRDTDVLAQEDPGKYQKHGNSVVAGFDSAVAELSGFGTALGEPVESRRRRAQRFDLPLTFLRIAQKVHSSGGGIRTACVVDQVAPGETGYRVRLRGSRDEIETSSIIVATGGRQADPSVRAELAGPASVLRSNEHSDGGGIDLACSLGAGINSANRGFYGHLFPHGVAPLSGFDYRALALYHSTYGVLVDRNGQRFTDESAGDPRNTIALAAHGGDGVLLWSQATQERAATDPGPIDLVIDRWSYARDRGGQVARAESLDEAARIVRAWGFADPAGALTTSRLTGSTVFLARVVPGVTYTYGGLNATYQGEVLDGNGDVIPGLFTAGADMSDIYHEGYCGGLSAAAVTGMTAGRAAATWALGDTEPAARSTIKTVP